jgi:hypothetical protein
MRAGNTFQTVAIWEQFQANIVMRKFTNTKKIILISLAMPLLSFILIQPDWLARLVADGSYCVVVTVMVFFFAFRSYPKPDPEKMIVKVSESEMKTRTLVVRGLIIAFGCLALYCDYLQLYDSVQVMRQGSSYLLKCEGKVTNNDSLYGVYMAEQSVSIEWNEGVQVFRNSFTASLFPRRARPGNTYYFIIAPKSGQILDFKETPIDN